MISILAKLFIKDRKNYSSPTVRRSYGIVCSIAGILLNIMLFIFKLFAGILSNSTAIVTDAVHNLTDSGSSVIMLISFIVSGRNFPWADKAEHIAGMIISVILIISGATLAKASAEKIICPEKVIFSFISLIILLTGLLTKLYMAHYNRKYSEKLNFPAMRAVATDCLCDCLTTVISASSLIAALLTDLNIDAYGGLTVSLFIIFAGIKSIADLNKPK